MTFRRLLCCLLALPAVVFADANQGQFMGYELGTKYPMLPERVEVLATGNLLFEAEDPVMPSGIVDVSLITTPGSHTIGYIFAASWHETEEGARAAGRRFVELLRAKYPDWILGGEVMDERMRIVEANFDKAPYLLQLRLARDEYENHDMWRFTMGLGWNTESRELRAWQDKSAAEYAAARTKEHERLVEEEDLQGL